MHMEAKLAEYRARKAKESTTQEREKSSLLTNLFRRQTTECTSSSIITESIQDDNTCTADDRRHNPEDSPPESRVWDKVTILEIGLKTLLWFALWGLFIELQFGAAYVVLSGACLLYRSLSTRKRKSSKLSAYSVFNPNFERLDGTFTAEQFERELRYGPSAVR